MAVYVVGCCSVMHIVHMAALYGEVLCGKMPRCEVGCSADGAVRGELFLHGTQGKRMVGGLEGMRGASVGCTQALSTAHPVCSALCAAAPPAPKRCAVVPRCAVPCGRLQWYCGAVCSSEVAALHRSPCMLRALLSCPTSSKARDSRRQLRAAWWDSRGLGGWEHSGCEGLRRYPRS